MKKRGDRRRIPARGTVLSLVVFAVLLSGAWMLAAHRVTSIASGHGTADAGARTTGPNSGGREPVGGDRVPGAADECASNSQTLPGAARSDADGKLLAAISRKLLDQPDERSRALGLVLAELQASAEPANQDACTSQVDCRRSSSKPQALAARTALVKLALTTADPDTYVIAATACDGMIGAGAAQECSMLSYERLAQIEPDNAYPWLEIAHRAAERGDATGQYLAMYQASQASHFESHFFTLQRALHTDAFRSEPLATRLLAQIDLIGVAAAQPAQYIRSTMNYCSSGPPGTRGPVQDPVRLPICSSLAELFVAQNSSLQDRMTGTKLAERAGWPSDRLAALREDNEALRIAETVRISKLFPPAGESASICKNLAQQERDLDASFEQGEIGSTRRWIAADGRSRAELAAQNRRDLEVLREKALREMPAWGDAATPAASR